MTIIWLKNSAISHLPLNICMDFAIAFIEIFFFFSYFPWLML